MSNTDSKNKAVTVTCPVGKKLIGAGGDIIPSSGPAEVTLHQIRPNSSLTSVRLQALEIQGNSGVIWRLDAVAMCADPPPGLQRVLVTSPSDSLDKSVSATCPGNTQLLDAAGAVTGGQNQVSLNDVAVEKGLKTATVRALEDQDGTNDVWAVTAYAICADPIVGLSRVVAESSNNSPDTELAICPDTMVVTGGGGAIGGGDGRVGLSELNPLQTTGDPGGFRVGALADVHGNVGHWFLRALAICAPSG